MIDLDPLLLEAQKIINSHHKDEKNFFSKCTFEFAFDQKTDQAGGYVTGNFPNYKIGIHEIFSEPTEDNLKFIILVFIHETLHIIHADWSENQVAKEEYRLANLAGLFDTLQKRTFGFLQNRRISKDLGI